MSNPIFSAEIDLKSVEIVSVDLFDTLLFRLVNEPKEVFLILEKIHNQRNFHQKRINMEIVARERKFLEEGHYEVNLNEIYLNDRSLIDVEIFLELSLIRANPEIVRFIEKARELGKKIIYTSDTYFEEPFINTLIRKLKLPVPDKLYLSNYYAKSKADGNLYRQILTDFETLGKSILHVGDNQISDIQNARIAGFQTMFYEKKTYSGKYKTTPHSSDQKLDSGILNSLMKFGDFFHPEMSNYWFEIGYKISAPLVLSQVLWLQNRVSEFDKVLFVSRDGFLLNEIWNKHIIDVRQTHYLNVSRLLLIQLIAKVDFELFVNELLRHERNSIGEILKAYGLDEILNDPSTNRSSIFDSKLNSSKNVKEFKNLLYEHAAQICEKFAVKTSVYEEYLEGIFRYCKKVALVDLGWHGTTQKLISKLFDIEVHGFYWGLWPWVDDSNKQAFAFKKDTNTTLYKLAKNCVEIFEFVLSAPHGTITGMRSEPLDRNFIPVMSSESSDLHKAKNSILQGVVSMYEDVGEFVKFYNFLTNPHLVAQPISKLILDPTIEDLRNFGKISHSILPGSTSMQTLILDENGKFPLWIRGELRALSNNFRFYNLYRLARLSHSEFGVFGTLSIVKRKFIRKFSPRGKMS